MRAGEGEFSELDTRQAASPQSCAILCSRSVSVHWTPADKRPCQCYIDFNIHLHNEMVVVVLIIVTS